MNDTIEKMIAEIGDKISKMKKDSLRTRTQLELMKALLESMRDSGMYHGREK